MEQSYNPPWLTPCLGTDFLNSQQIKCRAASSPLFCGKFHENKLWLKIWKSPWFWNPVMLNVSLDNSLIVVQNDHDFKMQIFAAYVIELKLPGIQTPVLLQNWLCLKNFLVLRDWCLPGWKKSLVQKQQKSHQNIYIIFKQVSIRW